MRWLFGRALLQLSTALLRLNLPVAGARMMPQVALHVASPGSSIPID
jgi:hypothetical protein